MEGLRNFDIVQPMFIRCIFCVITSYMLFSVVIAFGQNTGSQPSAQKPEVRKKIIYKEKSYYDFEDTLIRGDKAGPAGSSVFRKDRVEFKSSLNLKRSFMPELKSSASEAR